MAPLIAAVCADGKGTDDLRAALVMARAGRHQSRLHSGVPMSWKGACVACQSS